MLDKIPPTVPQPFIYGRPVKPNEFINREDDLRTVFNRLRNSESTAVVGEPHIGKSSLLIKLAHPETQFHFLGDVHKNFTFSLIDLHPISNEYSPIDFWNESLEPLFETPGDMATENHLEAAVNADYNRLSLKRLFAYLEKNERSLVLLLDEFERLLIHPNFQAPSFFALLRSLATLSGLSLVTASRLSVGEMNERGRRLLEIGSPFFNHFHEVRLKPFTEVNASIILRQAGSLLSDNDQNYIRRIAGRSPFLLQAMAATLLESKETNRHVTAAERFYERISSHFDEIWYSLNESARTTALILSVMELGGRTLGQDFAYGEIERIEAFSPHLRLLANYGIAEQVDSGWQFDRKHLLLWQGQKWTISSQAFTWWVRDVVVAETRNIPVYNEWLAQKRYRFLLTQQQWDGLINTVRSAPDWAIRGVGWFARMLFEELIQGRKK